MLAQTHLGTAWHPSCAVHLTLLEQCRAFQSFAECIAGLCLGYRDSLGQNTGWQLRRYQEDACALV
jgi:hypothetical protein